MIEPTGNETVKTSAPKTRGRKLGIAILTLLILILMGGLGFCYYQLSQVNIALAQTVADQQKKITDNQNQVTNLEKSFAELKQGEQKALDLSAQQEKLITDWHAAQKGDLNKWYVAEAQYLVKLANDHLQFTHDFTLALNLLKRADQTLQNIDDPNLIELRKSLASDITALEAQPQANVTNVYIRLNGINSQMDQLKLPETPLPLNKQTSETLPANLPWWKAGLTRSWETLRQVVVVRKYGSSTLPLVLPDEKIFLFQNLHAQMEQAMWGALHRDGEIYQTSLARAITWTQQYFDQNAVAKNVLQNLIDMQKINVQPPVANLASTLTQFDNYFAQAKTETVAAPTTTESAQ